MSACRSLRNLASCEGVSGEEVSGIIAGILNMIPAVEEDSLHLLLESLMVAIPVRPEVTAAYCSNLVDYVMSVWTKHSKDPLLLDIVRDFIRALTKVPESYPAVSSKIIPVVVTILKDSHEIPGLTEGAISFLTYLLQAGELPQDVISVTFPLIVNRALHTEDSQLHQLVAKIISSLVGAVFVCICSSCRCWPCSMVPRWSELWSSNDRDGVG